MPNLEGWKTFVINGVVALTFVTKAVAPDFDVPGVDVVTSLVDQSAAAVVAVLAFANLILRAVTSSPIFTPKAPE